MPGPLFHGLTPEEEALARSYFLRRAYPKWPSGWCEEKACASG
jgi:hypothetical protein